MRRENCSCTITSNSSPLLGKPCISSLLSVVFGGVAELAGILAGPFAAFHCGPTELPRPVLSSGEELNTLHGQKAAHARARTHFLPEYPLVSLSTLTHACGGASPSD